MKQESICFRSKEFYNKAVETTVNKIREYRKYRPKGIELIIKASKRHDSVLSIFDSLNSRLDRNVKLLITSPPYLQSQEYIRSFKLELAWLGYTGEEKYQSAD